MAQFKLDFSSNLSARRLHEITPGRRVNVATSTTTLETTDPPQGVRGEGRDLLLPEKPRPQRPDTTRLREPIVRRVRHRAPNPMGCTVSHSLAQSLQVNQAPSGEERDDNRGDLANIASMMTHLPPGQHPPSGGGSEVHC